ncbi:MAG: NAD-dependent protein deacylase [Spirochaetaceae bacterium]|nr:NAD-dependent protein deacylase [Spirochaetaceae bacterium]
MIQELQKIVDASSNIVFFGGAGVSTESGIPDFRSVDGLYFQKWDYPPETILSHSFFEANTKEFYRFYKEKMLCLDVLPNTAHYVLSELEKKGKLQAIITQNIDGLHQKAGSKCVFELHGSVHRNYCVSCGKFFPTEYIVQSTDEVPRCDSCGKVVKPDVVLYEEPLNNEVIENAIEAILKADTLIIGGTSLTVYPAAGFIDYFRGKNLVLLNKSETPADKKASLVIREPIGKILGSLVL